MVHSGPDYATYARKEKMLGRLRTVGGFAVSALVIGAVAYGLHEMLTVGPTHISMHDFANGNLNYGPDIQGRLQIDHVAGLGSLNAHYVTTYTHSDWGRLGTLTGNEYTVPASGSHQSFDILLDPNSSVANYHFQSGTNYDLVGKAYTEVIGHNSDGSEIAVELLNVNQVVVDNSSSSLVNSLASYGLVGGAIQGIAKLLKV